MPAELNLSFVELAVRGIAIYRHANETQAALPGKRSVSRKAAVVCKQAEIRRAQIAIAGRQTVVPAPLRVPLETLFSDLGEFAGDAPLIPVNSIDYPAVDSLRVVPMLSQPKQLRAALGKPDTNCGIRQAALGWNPIHRAPGPWKVHSGAIPSPARLFGHSSWPPGCSDLATALNLTDPRFVFHATRCRGIDPGFWFHPSDSAGLPFQHRPLTGWRQLMDWDECKLGQLAPWAQSAPSTASTRQLAVSQGTCRPSRDHSLVAD